jgi:drug/metabolite transporter (DMT)-like permease
VHSATTQRTQADLALVAVAFLWGFTFVIVKGALADASTLVFLALRFSIGAAGLFLILRCSSGALSGFLQCWRGGLVTGVLLFAGYVLQTAGLLTTSASKSAFLTGLNIVFVPILAASLARRVPHLMEWGGAILAIAGTAMLTLNSMFVPRLSTGDLLTIGCAIVYAFYIVAVEHFSSPRNHGVLALWQVLVVALASALTCGWIEPPRLVWTRQLVVALALTGLLATTLCYILYTWAQAHTTATRAAIIFALEPVFAAITALIWTGDRWTARTLAGAALILGAIVLVELKPAPRLAHPQG